MKLKRTAISVDLSRICSAALYEDFDTSRVSFPCLSSYTNLAAIASWHES